MKSQTKDEDSSRPLIGEAALCVRQHGRANPRSSEEYPYKDEALQLQKLSGQPTTFGIRRFQLARRDCG